MHKVVLKAKLETGGAGYKWHEPQLHPGLASVTLHDQEATSPLSSRERSSERNWTRGILNTGQQAQEKEEIR